MYFDDKNQGLVPLRKHWPAWNAANTSFAPRLIILHEQAVRGRQDAGDNRLRMPDYDFAWDMLDLSAHASARGGPLGRQDWMQGYGDPTDQSQLAPDHEYLQRFQDKRHQKWPCISTTGRKPQLVSILFGSAELNMLATQECTNDDPAPQFPVELLSSGWFIWRIGGDLSADVYDESLGDFDDLERGSDEPKWLEMSHQHVNNLAQEKPTYTFSTSDFDSATPTTYSTDMTVYSSALADAGIIVPVHVWPTTERVSAHLEGSLHYGIDVDGIMTTRYTTSDVIRRPRTGTADR